ncbi:MAG: pyruvate, phosphate dikinase [Thermoplasmata archaeon HGW-Thermoplasmata-1]|nr:MAG: pyruvate, phosphate dikinase [Thermoplasmata archaeon HGW-Thermoplasmata-1]
MQKKYVYDFSEGNASMKMLLGGKGANLAEMTTLGIPVPFGFTITTEACAEYYALGKKNPEGLWEQVESKLALLEKKMGLTFGDNETPLLVSVRSGAAASMPGMMDTILNLGLNDAAVAGLARKTGNERFVWDAYRRFIQMFGNVVMGLKGHKFEHVLEGVKHTRGVEYDTQLTAEDLKEVVAQYKKVVVAETGTEFPSDPKEQLGLAINAVFESWNNDRAILYRKLNSITGLVGTAVNIQSMVFGNMGETSGTGVCFSRNPSTGENIFYGEYLMNAQGEDVVAGIRTPLTISALEAQNPEIYRELIGIKDRLEQHYTDMQDMEFTIQEGTLYFLQTRNGKRTAAAALRIAVDMVGEGLIDKKKALLRVDPNQLDQLLHKQLDPVAKQKAESITKGLPASPGAAVGMLCFDAHRADELARSGKKVILARTETSPEDLIGMNAAQGILTSRGGMTSHAAVVARGMGKCCVAGCGDAKIHEDAETLVIGTHVFGAGDYITLDGSTGKVYAGQMPVVDPEISGDFQKIMEWADEFRTLKIRTNADIPRDAKVAVGFGAEGIGLCRTEHMFFEGDRITAMREMILAKDVAGRKAALAKLLPYQKSDFKGLFETMGGKPVTIRLLDPPLHEFLPHEEAEQKRIAGILGIPLDELRQKIKSLAEVNPMLGHRGCRLGITYPEITAMQATAIFEAAKEVMCETGAEVVPEIMVPLIGNVKELENQKAIIDSVAKKIAPEVKYLVGTMIEVPRAALTADQIAGVAEFFSFGTNDLTQMTLGFSRDDVGKFMPDYQDKGILDNDPFAVLDQTGVGQLVEMAVKKGRSVRGGLKCGICGEHGGEPSSVAFCHKVGLDYVSCSPYRVPIARLAAAHAALKEKKE